MLLIVIVLVAFVPSIVAQADPALEIASIKAQFEAAHIVPDLLPAFEPVAALGLQFGDRSVPAGTQLTVEGGILDLSSFNHTHLMYLTLDLEAQTQPEITVIPANSTVQLGDAFTLALLDPGPLGGDFSLGPTRHWLVNDVKIGTDSKLDLPPVAQAVTPYGGQSTHSTLFGGQ